MLTEDIQRVVSRLPPQVRKAVEKRGYGTFVAGGFVRAVIAGERPSDIDIFVASATEAQMLRDELVGDGSCFESDFAYSMWVQGQKVQVIHKWTFQSHGQLLSAFDFSVARAVVWCETEGVWNGEVSHRFYSDLAARRLQYMLGTAHREGIESGGTLLRMVKYLRRGYSISPENLTTVVLHAVVNGDPVDDDAYTQLVGMLREVDPADWPVTE